MITTVVTQFSTYEIDDHLKCVRRVTGVNPPTVLQGNDGEWRSYDRYGPYMDGLIFYWPTAGATITSPIVSMTGSDGVS